MSLAEGPWVPIPKRVLRWRRYRLVGVASMLHQTSVARESTNKWYACWLKFQFFEMCIWCLIWTSRHHYSLESNYIIQLYGWAWDPGLVISFLKFAGHELLHSWNWTIKLIYQEWSEYWWMDVDGHVVGFMGWSSYRKKLMCAVVFQPKQMHPRTVVETLHRFCPQYFVLLKRLQWRLEWQANMRLPKRIEDSLQVLLKMLSW